MTDRRRLTAAVLAALCLLAGPSAAPADDPVTLRVVSWNLQGNAGGSDPALIAEQLTAKDGVDVWGLSEVDADEFDRFRDACGADEGGTWEIVEGTTAASSTRLAIVYDADRLELLGQEELTDLQPSSGLRAPLVARFRGRETGQEFLFMVNHLARGNRQSRLTQAEGLHDWALSRSLPVIATGDYNIDFHIFQGDDGRRDPGFDALVENGAFTWVRPLTLVKTQSSDSFDTILDFVFVANEDLLPAWSGSSRILTRAGDAVAVTHDFDDSGPETDHRPVDAIFMLHATAPVGGGTAGTGDARGPGDRPGETETEALGLILEELRALRSEVRDLRDRVDELEGE